MSSQQRTEKFQAFVTYLENERKCAFPLIPEGGVYATNKTRGLVFGARF
jgi:hypothetical protein